MNEEDRKLIEEMKDNCIKQANYVDVKAMDKYNALRNLQQENRQLKDEIDNLNHIIAKQDKDIVIISTGNRRLRNIIDDAIKCLKDSKEYKVLEAMELPNSSSVLFKTMKILNTVNGRSEK